MQRLDDSDFPPFDAIYSRGNYRAAELYVITANWKSTLSDVQKSTVSYNSCVNHFKWKPVISTKRRNFAFRRFYDPLVAIHFDKLRVAIAFLAPASRRDALFKPRCHCPRWITCVFERSRSRSRSRSFLRIHGSYEPGSWNAKRFLVAAEIARQLKIVFHVRTTATPRQAIINTLAQTSREIYCE